MFNLKLEEEAMYRFCLEKEETAEHILREREESARLTFLPVGETSPTVNNYTKMSLSKQLNLWRKVG